MTATENGLVRISNSENSDCELPLVAVLCCSLSNENVYCSFAGLQLHIFTVKFYVGHIRKRLPSKGYCLYYKKLLLSVMESIFSPPLGHHTVLVGADCLTVSVSLSRHVKYYLDFDVGSQK